MKIFKITFHRTYEVTEKSLREYFENISEEDLEEKAVMMSQSLMSEEMVYFEDNLNDFVSHTVEIVEN